MGIRFDMIGVFVDDLPRMVAFYRDVLGVEIEGAGDGPHAEFKHEGIRFAMFSRPAFPKIIPELAGHEVKLSGGLNTSFELAIDLPRFADVDPAYRRAVAAGARPVIEPRDEPWGMRSSMVADPEGNLIEIREGLQAGDAVVARVLSAAGVTDVTIIGGTKAVSQTVQDGLTADGMTVERVAGDNRFAALNTAVWSFRGRAGRARTR